LAWVCDIPGTMPAGLMLHLALHVGLAAFVVGVGTVFLWLASIAYRRPLPPGTSSPSAATEA
jgi:hypothetical protein